MTETTSDRDNERQRQQVTKTTSDRENEKEGMDWIQSRRKHIITDSRKRRLKQRVKETPSDRDYELQRE